MKRSTKIILFLALGFLIAGLIFYGAAVAQTGRLNFGPVDLETLGPSRNTMVITDPVRSIQILDISSGIRFLPSGDGQITVEYTDTELLRHEITVSEGLLRISVKETGTVWNRMFDFSAPTQEIRVYLPAQDLERLELSSVSGDIALPGLNIGTLIIQTTSGDLTIENTTTEALQASSVSGNLIFTNTLIFDYAELTTVSGDIRFTDFDCPTLNAETVSGNVTGTIPEARHIRTDTTSGSVYISENRSDAPAWDIETVSGDIHITVGF